MKAVKAFGRFWYDFVIGDDWKIAAAVALALAVLVALLLTGALGDHVLTVLGALLVVSTFSISLLIDVRGPRR
jgi:hypothetical protein